MLISGELENTQAQLQRGSNFEVANVNLTPKYNIRSSGKPYFEEVIKPGITFISQWSICPAGDAAKVLNDRDQQICTSNNIYLLNPIR